MFAPWPKPLGKHFRQHYGLSESILSSVTTRYELVTQGRNLRREANVPSSKRVKFVLKPLADISAHDRQVLALLLNAESFEVTPGFEPPKGTPVVHSALGDLFMPLTGLVDIEAEKARLQKELQKAEAEIAKVQQKLNNPQFVQKVPPQVLAEHQQRLVEWQQKRDRAKAALEALG